MRFPVEAAPTEYEAPGIQAKRVARVLLADAALSSRLALKSILSTAGYAVSGAATASEAIDRLDEGEYQLVLADLRSESDEAGPRLLAYARQKEFRPATALLASNISETMSDSQGSDEFISIRNGGSSSRAVHISDENVYYLLDRVAELISHRAGRRIQRMLLQAV
jgi:CheY-like chemotaxis protein